MKYLLRDSLGFILELFPILFVIALLALVSVPIVAALDYKACANTGDIMAVHHEWRLFGGCYLERDGRMYPEDRWFDLESIE